MNITENQTVSFDSLIRTENPRLLNNESDPTGIKSLAESIALNGLQTPIVVQRITDDEYSLIRGCRRKLALENLRDSNPQRFSDLFPDNMIPCTIVEGTEQEIALYRIDHGQIKGLNTVEMYLAFEYLYRNGISVDNISVHLAGLLDQHYPLQAKPAKDCIEKKESAIKDALANGLSEDEAAEKGEQAYWTAYKAVRRGVCQNLQRIADCPNIVIGAWMSQKSNNTTDEDMPEGITLETIADAPKITFARAKKLREALAIDCKSNPKYSRLKPGNNFWSVWQEIKDEIKETEEKVSMLTKKDIERFKFQSVGFTALVSMILGNDIDFDIMESDLILAKLEALQESDNNEDSNLMDEVLIRGSEIMDENIAAAQTAGA